MRVIILCLFYLMVLIDCRTISKSISNEYNSDNVYEIITDLYSTTRNRKLKHHRNLHKLRRAENVEDTTKLSVLNKASDNVSRDHRLDHKMEDTKNLYPVLSTLQKPMKTTERVVITSSKWKNYVGEFWNRFRKKPSSKKDEDKNRKENKMKKKEYKRKNYNIEEINIDSHSNLKRNRRKQPKQIPLQKLDTTEKWYFDGRDTKKDSTSSSKAAKPQLPTTKYFKTKLVGNLRDELDKMTTEILQLKDLYSADQYPSANILDTTPTFETHTYPKFKTKSEIYYMGTVQLEELLNTIKMKATQMIADQNPSVADLISNSVTEATYNADPIFDRTESGIMGNAFSTFMSIGDLEDNFYKKLASSTSSSDFFIGDTAKITGSHEIFPRSITEDVMTIAQNVEDILQKEVKNAYKKMKKKLSSHVEKGVSTLRSTVKKMNHKSFGKTSPVTHPNKNEPTMTKKIYNSTTSGTKQTGKTNNKHGHKENIQTQVVTPLIETEDDYIMLTLYEQILSKTQEDNLMKMVTSNDSPLKVKKRERCRLSKRNPETVSDYKLKKDIKQIYDDGVNMPEYDYNDSLSHDDSTEHNEIKITEPYDARATTIAEFDKNGMEELLDKISFRDFVNGYKHYLRFQEDQANQNFSNLVRYQAHKHHSVDDIGKYILEKIPQLPAARVKRFFDDTDIDNQELSTKSDESWFKKHFYIFIDNGPPKKYHTSQTVSLKYPTTKAELRTVPHPEADSVPKGDNGLINFLPSEPYEMNRSAAYTDINLDELSKNLEEHEKIHSFSANDLSKQSNELTSIDYDPLTTTESNNKLLDTLYLIQKIFGGKNRRMLKNKNNINSDQAKSMKRNADLTEHLLYNNFITGHNMDETMNLIEPIGNIDSHSEKTNKRNVVNINVIPQPTSIVKIRDSVSTKKSRLRNFLHKFHFRKNKKKAFNKIKRQCQRHQRFNPFEKLKRIFSIKTITPQSHHHKFFNNIDDYGVMATHLDGTKSIKYNRILSPEEIRKQIPNITADNLDLVHNKGNTNSMKTVTESLFEVKSPLYVFDHPLSNYEMQVKSSTVTNKTLQAPGKYTNKKSTSIISTSTDRLLPTDLLMNINIKTLRPTKETFLKMTQDVLQHPLATPEELRSEIDKIQRKLVLFDETSPFIPVASDVDKINRRLVVVRESHFDEYDNLGHKFRNQLRKSNNYTSHLKNHGRDILQLNDGLFDLTNNKDENMIEYRYPDLDDRNLYTEISNKPLIHVPSLIDSYGTDQPLKHGEHSGTERDNQAYSDYFNDFILWNGDILNVDKLTTPMWKRILDSIQHNEYTTSGRNNIATKLRDLNNYMNIFFKTPKNKSFSRNQNVEVIDDTTPSFKEIRRQNPDPGNKKVTISDKASSKDYTVITEGAKYFDLRRPEKNKKDSGVLGNGITDEKSGVFENSFKDVLINEYRRSTESHEESSDILLDTTLLAYDDDVDSILTDTESKKKSRNSIKFTKGKGKTPLNHPTVTTNEHPKQYYTTLLPMSSTDFDTFLKQNALDVTLVTSPITTPTPYVDTWSHKIHPQVTNSFNNVKVTTNSENLIYTKKIESVIPKLLTQKVESLRSAKPAASSNLAYKRKSSDSELKYQTKGVKNKLYDNDLENRRHKRQIGGPYQSNFLTLQPYWIENGRQKKYFNNMKKKIKLFDNKKPTVSPDVTEKGKFDVMDILSTYEPEAEKPNTDVEITIINLDDIKTTSHDKDYYRPNTSRKEIKSIKYFTKPAAIASFAIINEYPNITKKYKNHNDLLFNTYFGRTFKPKISESIKTFTEETTKPMEVFNSDNHSTMTVHEFPIKYFPYGNDESKPKRVHISGHSYKFDILYDKRENESDSMKNARDIVFQSDHVTPAYEPEQQLHVPPGLAKNSEPTIKYRRNKRSHRHKSKAERNEVHTIDINEIPISKSVVNHSNNFDKNIRQKRLFRLLSLIKGKLKSPNKHGTSTVTPIPLVTELRKTISPVMEINTQTFVKELHHKAKASSASTKRTQDKSSSSSSRNSRNDEEQNFDSYDTSDLQLGQEFQVQNSTGMEHFKTKSRDNCGTKVDKRDVETQNTFTAKDVAALEVIVDLMKNTVNYGDSAKSSHSNETEIPTPSTTEAFVRTRDSLNSIEVHIAVPYGLQNESKRSLDKGPMRVRKVFSAKMSSPVDLEYQVHSYEGSQDLRSTLARKVNSYTSTTPATLNEGLSPGMYLLVHKLDLKNGFELKPVTDRYNSTLINNTKNTNKVEVTTIQNRGRVTLSKDFLSAINKQIMQLFQNIPTDIPNRKAREADGENFENTKTYIDWEAIKKYFGHDRVCNCKCEPNKPMCRACAASDAIIGELIFEFDNMAKFMKDHCTEIQTFFWMNPSGGKKLREVVHKIDSNLKDYYKRVKGKCQGRTCKTFSLFVDKRDFIKHKKIKKEEINDEIINVFTKLAEDLEKTSKIATCFNKQLTDKGYKMIDTMGKCLHRKLINKRSNTDIFQTRTKQNVYSLDNINVNIICDPKISSSSKNYAEGVSEAPLLNVEAPILDPDILDIIETNLNEKKRNSKKYKESNKFLKTNKKEPKKKKLFTYFVREKASLKGKKRDIYSQIETPLISDSGGTFWHDYINGKMSESRIVRATKTHGPTLGITVIQSKTASKSTTLSNNDLNSPGTHILMTVQTTPKLLSERQASTLDALSSNIVQLLKSIGSEEIDETESDNIYNNSTVTTAKHHSTVKCKMNKKKKPKNKKTNKTHKTIKQTAKSNSSAPSMANATMPIGTNTTTPSTTTQSSAPTISIGTLFSQKLLKGTSSAERNNKNNSSPKCILGKIIDSITKGDFVINENLSSKATTSTTSTSMNSEADFVPTEPIFLESLTKQDLVKAITTTKKYNTSKGFFGKFVESITKGDYVINDTSDDRKTRFSAGYPYYIYNLELSNDNTTKSATEVSVPNMESEQQNGYKKESLEYTNLLLSIIQFETSELIDEWLRHAIKQSSEFSDEFKLKNKPVVIRGEHALGDYDIIKSALSPPTSNSLKHKGLLDRIANKMGLKLGVSGESGVKTNKVDKKTYDDTIIRPTLHNVDSSTRQARGKLVTGTEEIYDSTHQICDLQTTYDHIADLFYTLPTDEFENYIRNLSCYKYKIAKPFFYIEYPPKKVKRWDWIRKKRSFNNQKSNQKVNQNVEISNFGTSLIEEDYFEKFVKDTNGIYRVKKRRKRMLTDLKDLDRELRNVYPLKPALNEVYAMVGDTIKLQCSLSREPRVEYTKYVWMTEREDMLEHDNIDINGPTVTIHDVQARNVGSYVCSKDDELLRSIRVSVVAPPNYTVMFAPNYFVDQECDEDDLKAIKLLGTEMSSELSCGDRCSIRFDEAVCLKDRVSDRCHMQSTAFVTVGCHTAWDCSVQCRRDLQTAFALLYARSVHALVDIPVVVYNKGVNKTYVPTRSDQRVAFNDELRKNASGGIRPSYASLSPSDVQVLLACSAGYYLLRKQKICAPCPPNTSSAVGDNVCSVCPHGTRSKPGASSCHRADGLLRRYDWWWYPPCGYLVACGGCVCACGVFVVSALLLRGASRAAKQAPCQPTDLDVEGPSPCRRKVFANYMSAPARPVSASRVILAKFFKPSLTSSIASDSQENKFDIWKEKNKPPPLPPIDFDM